ncbi:hypothetical protein FDB53_17180 [Clostridium botulinum]|uniref:hypothetical protein n=1 Tax=Clostridium botulinum TaxID=1491 RepID=UPI000773DA44|nr:hypothetical protein [Clostridium botulinum]NFN46900.1 hypothetical protein [Clostridium botulinum]
MIERTLKLLEIGLSIFEEEECINFIRSCTESVINKASTEEKKIYVKGLIENLYYASCESYEDLMKSKEYEDANNEYKVVFNKYFKDYSFNEFDEIEKGLNAGLLLEKRESYKQGLLAGLTRFNFLKDLIEEVQ